MISKSMHFGRKLPGRGPFSRIRRKRDACGAILASQGPGADATQEGDAGGGARWARWGAMRARRVQWVRAAAGWYSGDGARWERAGGGKQNWGAALAAHGCRMRAMAHFWLQWDGCYRRRLLRGWLCREGEMKKRPHMRPLYVKAISFERLYGKLERELRLSSSRRVPQSSSWGERIRGKLQEPW